MDRRIPPEQLYPDLYVAISNMEGLQPREHSEHCGLPDLAMIVVKCIAWTFAITVIAMLALWATV